MRATAKAPRTFSPEAMEKLLTHTWPGNIRELENAVERACVTARGASIQPEDLPLEVLHVRPAEGAQVDLSKPLPDLLREVTLDLERRYLTRAMKKSRGNVGAVPRFVAYRGAASPRSWLSTTSKRNRSRTNNGELGA